MRNRKEGNITFAFVFQYSDLLSKCIWVSYMICIPPYSIWFSPMSFLFFIILIIYISSTLFCILSFLCSSVFLSLFIFIFILFSLLLSILALYLAFSVCLTLFQLYYPIYFRSFLLLYSISLSFVLQIFIHSPPTYSFFLSCFPILCLCCLLSSLSTLHFTWPSCLPSPLTVASSTASVNAFKAQLEKMIGDEPHTHTQTHIHTHSYTQSQHPVVPDQIGSFMGLACPGLVWLGWLGWMCGLNCADLA